MPFFYGPTDARILKYESPAMPERPVAVVSGAGFRPYTLMSTGRRSEEPSDAKRFFEQSAGKEEAVLAAEGGAPPPRQADQQAGPRDPGQPA